MTTPPLGTQPVDITVDKIPDDAFKRTKQIIKLLTATEDDKLTPEEIEEIDQTANRPVGDFGYYVQAGNHGDTHDKLTYIFMGKFRGTPLIVTELETILKEHAAPEDLELKP